MEKRDHLLQKPTLDEIDMSEVDSDQLADSDPKLAIKKPFQKPALMLEDSGSL